MTTMIALSTLFFLSLLVPSLSAIITCQKSHVRRI